MHDGFISPVKASIFSVRNGEPILHGRLAASTASQNPIAISS